jgi:2,3-bisphosphoglycerate-dependent phosphoglycerate mutase
MDFLQLLFVRHAQSIANQQGRMEGRGMSELSEQGRSQVVKLAQRLLALNWLPSQIYSSPLPRAAQTTELLVAHYLPLIPIEFADDLQEFDHGIFQGLTWAEAQTHSPQLCQQLEASLDWLPIPSAESLKDGRDRAHRFIQMLLNRHSAGEQILVVTHSWILQQLVSELLGCDRTWGFEVQHTALFEFWCERSRWERQDQNRFNTELWQIRRFNDASHL